MANTKKLAILATVALNFITFSAGDSQACGGRGGGGFGGYSVRSAPAIRYAQPRYHAQPTYSQQAYSQSSYPPASYNQSSFSGAVQARSGIQQSQITSIRNGGPVQRSVGTQPAATQGRSTQALSSSRAAEPTTQSPRQAVRSSQSPASAQRTALAMLIGSTGAGSASNSSSTESAIPEFQQTSVTQSSTPTQVGTWTATLSGGASVTLQLNDDGTFNWSANSKGKRSSFSGQFTIANNRLTLSRSDNQQLTGDLTLSGNNQFTFKANGSKAGLSFSRG